ncbi:unnamed protein product [Ectocarpus sp. 12 AP-2014]
MLDKTIKHITVEDGLGLGIGSAYPLPALFPLIARERGLCRLLGGGGQSGKHGAPGRSCAGGQHRLQSPSTTPAAPRDVPPTTCSPVVPCGSRLPVNKTHPAPSTTLHASIPT